MPQVDANMADRGRSASGSASRQVEPTADRAEDASGDDPELLERRREVPGSAGARWQRGDVACR